MAQVKETTRTRRTPINGTRNRLNVRGQEDGYVYRIVNDVDDRVQQLQDAGYEIVTDSKVTVGDKRIANPTQEGSPVKVSVGQGVQAYVMRQKQEWYDEDRAAKDAKVAELESQMKRDAKDAGFYGKLNIGEK